MTIPSYSPVVVGTWTRPHPDIDLARSGQTVSSFLFQRPPDEQKPRTVTERYQDDALEWKTREVPFEDPILGASWNCDGCGEPFGEQIKLNKKLWASRPAVAYDTISGRLYFCQDAWGCAKRAAERGGERVGDIAYERNMADIDRKLTDEEEPEAEVASEQPKGSTVKPIRSKICRVCRAPFMPTHIASIFCSPQCRAVRKAETEKTRRTNQTDKQRRTRMPK